MWKRVDCAIGETSFPIKISGGGRDGGKRSQGERDCRYAYGRLNQDDVVAIVVNVEKHRSGGWTGGYHNISLPENQFEPVGKAEKDSKGGPPCGLAKALELNITLADERKEVYGVFKGKSGLKADRAGESRKGEPAVLTAN